MLRESCFHLTTPWRKKTRTSAMFDICERGNAANILATFDVNKEISLRIFPTSFVATEN